MPPKKKSLPPWLMKEDEMEMMSAKGAAKGTKKAKAKKKMPMKAKKKAA